MITSLLPIIYNAQKDFVLVKQTCINQNGILVRYTARGIGLSAITCGTPETAHASAISIQKQCFAGECQIMAQHWRERKYCECGIDWRWSGYKLTSSPHVSARHVHLITSLTPRTLSRSSLAYTSTAEMLHYQEQLFFKQRNLSEIILYSVPCYK